MTQAEYKDIKVTRGEKTLLECDFSKGAAGWKTSRGKWEAKDGAYRQTATEADVRAVIGDTKWTDYTYTLKARKLGGAEGFLILFRVRDQGNWAWWNIGGWSNAKHAIEMATDGQKRTVGNEARGQIETGRWYDIRIEVQGPTVRCFLDGKKIHEVTDTAVLPALYACAGRVQAAGEVILKVVNVSGSAQDAQIDLAGAGKVEPRAAAIVLTGAGPDDENTLDEPARVAPAAKTVENAAAGFRHTFPPWSVTILRLKTGGNG
jgi:alpha-L-arabinofuranosidase